MAWLVLINVFCHILINFKISNGEEIILDYHPYHNEVVSNKINIIRPLPHYIQPCKRVEETFNLCVKRSAQIFINDIPEDVPKPIDPFHLDDEIRIEEGDESIGLNMTFRDVSILGFKKTKVLSVRSNLNVNKLEMGLKYPVLNFIGEFNGVSNLGTFPLVGSGEFSFNMTDVSATWIIYLSEESKSNAPFQIDQLIFDMIPVEITAEFGKAVDGDSEFGDALNKYFNENSQEFFRIVKPKILDALTKEFTRFFNNIDLEYSSADIIPP